MHAPAQTAPDISKILLQRTTSPLIKGGVLIICEAIIDDQRRQNTFGLTRGLNMLIESRGGFDRTSARTQAAMP